MEITMNWIILIAFVAVVIWFSARPKSVSSKPKAPAGEQTTRKPTSKTFTTREGQSMEADESFRAWTSGNLSDMVKALDKKTNLIDRHFLLMSIVDQTYKNRSDSENADLLRKVAEMHLAEFPKIKPALKREMDGILPRVTTFQKYSTFLTEEKEYEKAIEVCESAIRVARWY